MGSVYKVTAMKLAMAPACRMQLPGHRIADPSYEEAHPIETSPGVSRPVLHIQSSTVPKPANMTLQSGLHCNQAML